MHLVSLSLPTISWLNMKVNIPCASEKTEGRFNKKQPQTQRGCICSPVVGQRDKGYVVIVILRLSSTQVALQMVQCILETGISSHRYFRWIDSNPDNT